MAAAVPEESLKALAETLQVEDIPVKLRCAFCNLLCWDAWRTDCCNSSICDRCKNDPDTACQVCGKDPTNKDAFKIARPLRNTIRAFLKKIVLDREKQGKAAQDAAKKVNTAALPSASVQSATLHNGDSKAGVHGAALEQEGGAVDTPKSAAAGPQMDVPHPSIESSNATQQDSMHEKIAPSQERASEHGREDSMASMQANTGDRTTEIPQPLSGNGANMDLSNGNMAMNPMQLAQMMSMMQNGMGMDPMSMMGMNPMMMNQMANMTPQMFAAMSGMSINGGMNMGMGFGGQGQFGGFGQNDSWMNQDGYNANAYGNANFGVHNSGYNNQGNYNNQYQTHDFHGGSNRGFNRGRGRGRGYGYYNRGRGGYYQNHNSYNQDQGNQQAYTNQNAPQQTEEQWDHDQEQGQRRGSPVYGNEAERNPPTEDVKQEAPEVLDPEAQRRAEEQMMKELNPGGMEDDEEQQQSKNTATLEAAEQTSEPKKDEHEKEQDAPLNERPDEGVEDEKQAESRMQTSEITDGKAEQPEPDDDNEPKPIQSFVSGDDTRFARNSYRPPAQAAPATNIANPQYQQGIWSHHSQARPYRNRPYEYSGASAANDDAHANNAPVQSTVAPTEPIGLGVAGAPTGPRALREGLPNTGYSSRGFRIQGRAAVATPTAKVEERRRSPSPSNVQRPESRSPSPTEHRSSHHKNRRHRSRSRSRSPRSEESEEERHERSRRGERRRRRSRKHEEDGDDAHDDGDSSSRYSSHRHHRRRHDKDYESSSRRHRRDRDRDRDRDHDRDYDRQDKRRHRRRRSRSTGTSSAVPTPTSANPQDLLKSNGSYPSSADSRKRRHERDDDHDRSKRSKRDNPISDDYDHPSRRHKEREPSKTAANGPTTTPAPPISAQAPTQHTFTKPPPTGPRGSHSSQNRPVVVPLKEDQPKAPPTAPSKDPHTLEREARNAERLQREMQRRAYADAPQGKRRTYSGRKLSYKYEDENTEEVARRGELLREGGRWG